MKAAFRRIKNAEDFGRVAVLYGGVSGERDISLMTGKAVLGALQERGVDARGIDAGADLLSQLPDGGFDRVWIALHGPGGEDGVVQGALEWLGLPYTGTGVMGSALCMDKLRSKRLLMGAGLPTPEWVEMLDIDDCAIALDRLGLPLITKPSAEGSSLGMSKVDNAEQITAAYEAAAQYGEAVLAEKWIDSPEYTASILHDETLPLIRIEAANTFYDYEAKYFSDETRYRCPAGLDESTEQAYAETANRAFDALGATGWGRVDFMIDENDQPLILEANTIPGMTSHSLVPMAAKQKGINFSELVWRVLETSFCDRGHNW